MVLVAVDLVSKGPMPHFALERLLMSFPRGSKFSLAVELTLIFESRFSFFSRDFSTETEVVVAEDRSETSRLCGTNSEVAIQLPPTT